MFAWDEVTHAGIGWKGDALMVQELFCPDALGGIHTRHPYGPTSVALCKLLHRGTLPLLVYLT